MDLKDPRYVLSMFELEVQNCNMEPKFKIYELEVLCIESKFYFYCYYVIILLLWLV